MKTHAEDKKKIKARDRLKDYCQRKWERDFDHDLNNNERSKVFLKFYIEEIYNKTQLEITEDDFESGFVDRSSDLGIDFITKNDDTVTIIQAKYRGDGKSESDVSIIEFKSLINRISNKNFIGHDVLEEILGDIDFASNRFKLIFITMGKISGQALIEAETSPIFNSTLADIEDRFEIVFLDEQNLNEELRNAIQLGAVNLEKVTKFNSIKNNQGKRTSIIELVIGDRKQCILTVSANQLRNAYNSNQDGLFSLNIRNYIGNISFNKGIKETAINNPGEFYFFNNGISCLARTIDINHELGEVTLKGLQVINGAQTVRTLAKSVRAASLDSIFVLTRITEIGDPYKSNEKKFIEEITQFNNSQNAIKSSDFRSNDLIQRDLEKQFNDIRPINGQKVIYYRKRTDKPKAGIAIKFEDFAKVLHAFLVDPISFSSSTKYLFGMDKGDGYIKVFGDGEVLFDSFDPSEFKFRAAVWWLGNGFLKRIAEESKTLRIEIAKSPQDSLKEKELRAMQAKWFFIYGARILLERSEPNYKDHISKYYEKPWEFNVGPIGAKYDQLFGMIKDVVVGEYIDASEEPNFVHRNWLRSTKTMNSIANQIKAKRVLIPDVSFK
jgi:hypothetical protein